MQVLAPILLSPHDPNTVYFGAQYLFRSRDRGDTWEKLTGDLSYDDKTRLGDIPHQLVITISESPKKNGLDLYRHRRRARCTCRWTTARSGRN